MLGSSSDGSPLLAAKMDGAKKHDVAFPRLEPALSCGANWHQRLDRVEICRPGAKKKAKATKKSCRTSAEKKEQRAIKSIHRWLATRAAERKKKQCHQNNEAPLAAPFSTPLPPQKKHSYSPRVVGLEPDAVATSLDLLQVGRADHPPFEDGDLKPLARARVDERERARAAAGSRADGGCRDVDGLYGGSCRVLFFVVV